MRWRHPSQLAVSGEDPGVIRAPDQLARPLTVGGKQLVPAVPVKKLRIPSISSEMGNAMKMGKRYRLTSDHSPIFSLFTFFLDRQ